MANFSFASDTNKNIGGPSKSNDSGRGRGDQSRDRELQDRKDRATAAANASRDQGQARDNLASLVAAQDKADKLAAYNANVAAVAAKKAKEAAAVGRSDQSQQRYDQAPTVEPSFLDKIRNFGQSQVNPAPSGSVWDNNRAPQERGYNGLSQTPQSSAFGMQGAGAYYPTGKDKSLSTPDSAMGMLAALMNPIGATVKEAGSVLYNQSKYGMNDQASREYTRLLQDPANAGMSEAELVTLARKPQIDAQLPHAFTDGNPRTPEQIAIAALTNGKAPSSTIYNADGTINMQATAATAFQGNSNQGAFTGGPSIADLQGVPQVNPYALDPSLFDNGQRPSWAPTMQPTQQVPSWAPQWEPETNIGGMLRAPMALQAPPSTWS